MNAASGSARRNSLMVLMGCPPCGRAIDGVSSKGHTSPHPHDSAEFRRSRRAKASTAGHGLVPDWRTSRPAMPGTPLRDWSRLSRAGALRGGVDRVERLARRHEQTVPLGTAEADVAADLRQPDATDELGLRRPYGHAAVAHLQPLAQPRLEPARGVAGPTGRIGGALVELAAVRRIGEPVAAVRMRDDVVGRVEPLAVVLVGDERDGPVVLVAHHAPGQVLARELAALEVERVAVAVV